MKELITKSEADIVFLQEVVGRNEKYKNNGLLDTQIEFLADGIWPHYSYGRNAVYDHGDHGNMILSKFPIKSFENINLSTNPFEQRGMLICRLETTSGLIYAVCLHLNLLHSGRALQYENIGKHIKEKKPIIVAGDFNDWNQKSFKWFDHKMGMKDVYKTLHGHYAKTFPSMFPFLSLDRIYVKGFSLVSANLLQLGRHNIFSDHLPLVAELSLDEE
jgi:endonuclease/exonuclease/phosphatase family metal-dependent hydrolase